MEVTRQELVEVMGIWQASYSGADLLEVEWALAEHRADFVMQLLGEHKLDGTEGG
jgi:hypothetical protein